MTQDLWRLSPEGYAFTCQLTTRYADLDCQSYLSDVAICRLLEAARYSHLLHLFGSGAALAEHFDTVLVKLTLEQLKPGRHEGIITGAVQVAKVGNTSFEWATALFHGRSCIALSDVTQVCVDVALKPRPISASIRERLLTMKSP